MQLPGPVEERRFLALGLTDDALEGVGGMIGKPPGVAKSAPRSRKRA
jgi:predicted N-acetyltransferase YhbS